MINIARVKHLFDEPGKRSSHSVKTPSLGGIAIFAGIAFSVIFWTPTALFGSLQYMLCAFVVIFFIGVRDDIIPMSARKKLLGELIAAGILVYKANILITGLHGFFGVYHIPGWFSPLLTIFTIIVIVNSFNLIDGINGLSGSISIIVSVSLGTWFFLVDHIEYAILAFSLAGAVFAFLRYNVTPAKVFMGDTGALLLGMICSILIIQFIEINDKLINSRYAMKSAPVVAIGILILPLFDTARVFAIRILQGRSPFYPDRLHIHHLLIDLGLTHMQATAILAAVSVGFIALVTIFQGIGDYKLLALILSIATILSYALQKQAQRKVKL